jgi:hypothetical protein
MVKSREERVSTVDEPTGRFIYAVAGGFLPPFAVDEALGQLERLLFAGTSHRRKSRNDPYSEWQPRAMGRNGLRHRNST